MPDPLTPSLWYSDSCGNPAQPLAELWLMKALAGLETLWLHRRFGWRALMLLCAGLFSGISSLPTLLRAASTF